MSILPNFPIAGTTQIWAKDSDDQRDNDSALANRTSLYVDVFQSITVLILSATLLTTRVTRPLTDIHDIVMEHEKFLFSSEELAYFQRLNALSCESMTFCGGFVTQVVYCLYRSRSLSSYSSLSTEAW